MVQALTVVLFFLLSCIILQIVKLVSEHGHKKTYRFVVKYAYKNINFDNYSSKNNKYVLKNKNRIFCVNNSGIAKKRFKKLAFVITKRKSTVKTRKTKKYVKTINRQNKQIFFLRYLPQNRLYNVGFYIKNNNKLILLSPNKRVVKYNNKIFVYKFDGNIFSVSCLDATYKPNADVVNIAVKLFVWFKSPDYVIQNKKQLKFSNSDFNIKITNQTKTPKPIVKVNDTNDNVLVAYKIKNNLRLLVNGINSTQINNRADSNTNKKCRRKSTVEIPNAIKVFGNVFNYNILTADAYLNKTINTSLPAFITKRFKSSDNTNLYSFIFSHDIANLKGFGYKKITKWLLSRQEYERLYSYLLSHVLGVGFMGNRLVFYKTESYLGKIEINYQNQKINKYNLQNGFYYVYNNIIYKNVSVLLLKNNADEVVEKLI